MSTTHKKKKKRSLLQQRRRNGQQPVSRHRHLDGGHYRGILPDEMLPGTRPVGDTRHVALPVRYGRLLPPSTLYHSLKHHNPWKRRLRHWDHAAIYWHIAGSFSPVTLIALRDEGLWGWGLFCFGLVVPLRHYHQLPQNERTQLCGNGVLHPYGAVRAGGVQTAFCRCARILLLDYRRRGML